MSALLLTGALSREEALPPMAGAALDPSQDDPGHVHPHFTFTGQLSQHQAVDVAMKEEASFVLHARALGETSSCHCHPFLPHHWSNTKTLSAARDLERGCISLLNLRRDITQTFRRKWMGTGGRGRCNVCENGRLVDQKDARDQADECVLEFECTALV